MNSLLCCTRKLRCAAAGATLLFWSGCFQHLHADSDVTVSSGPTVGGSFAGTNPSVFTPTSASSVADVAMIQGSLNDGSAVTVNTASTAAGNGDLTITEAISKTSGANSALTLDAVRDLVINAPISSNADTLPLVLNAGRNMTNSQTITSNGGDIALGPTQVFTVGATITAGEGRISILSGIVESATYQTIAASDIQVASGAALRLHGAVTGSLTVAGTVSPAPTGGTGSLQVDGAVTLQSTATTVIDLGGTSQGSAYDSIGTTDEITVAGGLQVNLVNNFHDTISSSHAFTVVQGGSLTGTFDGYPNGSRITLADDFGSLRVNYTSTQVVLDDWQPVIIDIEWDPGASQAGTQILNHLGSAAGSYWFRVTVPDGADHGMRVRLRTTSGEAALYVKQESFPRPWDYTFASAAAGDDPILIQPDQYGIGQEWFILVRAEAGSQWDLLAGEASLPLTWDPGTTQAGTQVYVHPDNAPGYFWFRITAQTLTEGAWRNALTVTSGEANLYFRRDRLPDLFNHEFESTRTGSDGFVIRPDQFTPGQTCYLLVHVPSAATWSLVTGDAYVQNLGQLQFTDTNNDTIYDVTETLLESGSGAVAVGAEGVRFFKATVPSGTPAWNLWLGGAGNNILVRKNFIPFKDGYADRVQPGRMLLVPDYLQASADVYYIGIEDAPGATVHLHSRIQAVTDIAFGSTQTVACDGTDAGYRTFRVQVPIDQIAWENAVTNVSGDGNVCVRRDVVPNEFHNDAVADTVGITTDSVTLSPPSLTNGTFFMTVFGTATYEVSFRNGNPVVTNVPFLGTTLNDTPAKAGWRYYAVTDIGSQFGQGWELELTGAPPGTEIAIRRNAVPARWRYRNHESLEYYLDNNGHVDFSSTNGLLQQVDHQSDVWYIGVYNPSAPLGAFTLTRRLASAAPLAFDAGTTVQSGHLPGVWRWFLVNVPPGPLGWDLRLRDVTAGMPRMVIRRDLLPGDLGYWYYDGAYYFPGNLWTPGLASAWPSGHQWAEPNDLTQRGQDPGLVDATYRHFTAAMGHPLEQGTYYVGVRNDDPSVPAAYTLESRGIGAGLAIPVSSVAFSGGTANITGLAPRDLRVFRVTVPPNTPHWSLQLTPSAGDMMMMVRRGGVPTDNGDLPPYWPPSAHNPISPGMRVTKQGNEYLSIFPADGAAFLPEGDYYIMVLSDGDLPPNPNTTGTGPSSGTLTSLGAPLVNLGTVQEGAPSSQLVALSGGETKVFSVDVPPGLATLEVRLDNRSGNPQLAVRPGAAAPVIYDYGYDGGSSSGVQTHASVVTFANPPAGAFTITVRARHSEADGNLFSDASATLVVSAIPPSPLNFGSYANGGGGSNLDSRQIIDGAKVLYQVAVPATIAGQPVLGWKVDAVLAQGDVRFKFFKDVVNRAPFVETTKDTATIVPPFFTPGDTWYVEVTGIGITDYTIISEPIMLQRPAWPLPPDGQLSSTPGLTGFTTFGDSGLTTAGVPLPGDQGIDLGQDDWHFYAVTVPPGNRHVLRTVLEALNGDPDIYLRRGDPPSPMHGAHPGTYQDPPLQDYASTGPGTHYGNWVPLSARYEEELAPGTWYLGVTAAGGTNCRYRLKTSVGDFQTLALNGGSLTNQSLIGGDWKYYALQVPESAPLNWDITFATQQGGIQVHWRHILPPGDSAGSPSVYGDPVRNAYDDQMNQGPYQSDGWSSPGTYTVTCPPLRPGSSVYLGVKANNDALFSISCATSGGSLPIPPTLDFATGVYSGSVPPGTGPIFKIVAPADAARLKFSATHAGNVEVRLEQGAWPTLTGSAHWIAGINWPDTTFNQVLSANSWPWQPGRTYYLRLVNTAAAPEFITIQMKGRTILNDDEDNDGLPDAWEMQYLHTLRYGPLDDPNQNGISNLLAYALGLDPLAPRVMLGDVLSVSMSGAGSNSRLSLALSVPDPLPGGITYVVEATGSLLTDSWATIATATSLAPWSGSGTVTQNSPIGGYRGVQIIDTEHQSTALMRFMRLKIIMP